MGAISDLSQLINTLTGGTAAKEQLWFYQDNRQGAAAGAATVSGRFTSMWTYNKSPGGTGAAPGGTARNPTRSTTGALGQANPGGGRQKYLCGLQGVASGVGVLTLYDRLADISGLSGTNTAAQTITGLSVSRYTGTESVGNQIWLEIYSLIGTTATTVTVEYTNQDGTTGRTSQAVAIGGTGLREATRVIPVPLASGDTGVRAVTNIDLVASTGTAGDIGVTIARPLVNLPIGLTATGVGVDCVTQLPSLPEIKTDAALDFCWFANATTTPQTFGTLSMVEA
jgi:hypothetical protein